MPEIIEVKKYVDFLNYHLKNDTIIEINILNGRYKKHGPFENYDLFKKKDIKIDQVKSKGKFIYFELKNMADYVFFNTLGLSGGWVFSNNDTKIKKYKLPKTLYKIYKEYNNESYKQYKKNSINHLNIEFKLKSGGSLFYFDVLSFGTFKICSKDKLANKLNQIGPDLLMAEMNVELFKERLMLKKNDYIGFVLLNQKIISGIGNYLRADALWLAKISPYRIIADFSNENFNNLYQAIMNLLWSDYNYEYGLQAGKIEKTFKMPTDFSRVFFIYNNITDIYGNKITKEKMHDRSIYWVKNIQK